ncbi:hypothetical protein BVG19_g2573 [[Candida] boidinii]|nr:hypothetical protein BVG19_g2573 [[Candida] boidinii]OWB49159.1 hypothetical protein B5S27_g699 [[Candida] boidinii]
MVLTRRILKVGFFGSDNFSVNCLKRILPLTKGENPVISSLDIITRSPKVGGRGMKLIRDVPIATFAQENNLNLLRADKKSDLIELTKNDYNIAIAVSYGKLIPNEFLSTLQFGGLNVHPSILPKYSGPAPLHRALLNGDKVTGCTIQTLHPTTFDKGDILLQQDYKIEENTDLSKLSKDLSVLGGDLLATTLKNGLFDSTAPTYKTISPVEKFSYAGKVFKNESQINWDEDSSVEILRKYLTLGPLFTFKKATPKKKKANTPLSKRVVLSDIGITKDITPTEAKNLQKNGDFVISDDLSSIVVKSKVGYVKSDKLKAESFGEEKPKEFFNGLRKKFGNEEHSFHFTQLE